MPFAGEVTHATAERPYLNADLAFDRAWFASPLLLNVPDHAADLSCRSISIA